MTPDFRNRLATIDRSGGRIQLFPAEVRGFWRTRRNWVQGFLILFFLCLPWIKINGEPTVLVDFQRKVFIFFGLEFWAHDGFYVFFLLAFAAVGLALLTALFGRAWCGWACPQTVFLDGVFRKIETWIEGGHLQRRELQKAPWTYKKILKKTSKWSLFILFSILITHSFLAYFFSPEKILGMMTQSPIENQTEFIFILFINSLFLFNFAWFREQFCLIVCPYGRIQSILMDSHSLTVHYDTARGEPRKRKGVAQLPVQQGACVDCRKCVQVCPTGIDIRNGLQMECISCTACIDACDSIMTKTRQPPGLIAYRSLRGQKPKIFRFRTLFYGAMLLFLSGTFAYFALSRKNIEVLLLRALDTPYFELSDSSGNRYIANAYRLRIHNQTRSSVSIQLAALLSELPKESQVEFPKNEMTLKVDEFRAIPFLVKVPVASLQSKRQLKIKIQVNDQIREADFVSPTF
ncbi:MAG: cytochrome c oxidase accessory protein CcoG [Pseudobdellovibrionaceae bacterium]